jgi:hypothetical protein
LFAYFVVFSIPHRTVVRCIFYRYNQCAGHSIFYGIAIFWLINE